MLPLAEGATTGPVFGISAGLGSGAAFAFEDFGAKMALVSGRLDRSPGTAGDAIDAAMGRATAAGMAFAKLAPWKNMIAMERIMWILLLGFHREERHG
jgi:hypothetical protein